MAFPIPMPRRLVLIETVGEPAGNGHEYLLEIAIFGNIAGNIAP
jgi:hypothetical protein